MLRAQSPVWNAQAEDKVVSGRGPHISGGSITFGMAGVNGGGHQGGEGNDQGGEWFVRILFDRPTFSYSHDKNITRISHS